MNRHLKAAFDRKASRIIATTNAVDRDGEVVDPRGVKNFDAFMATNPVILWQHKHDQAPVGKATGGTVTDDRIELSIEWAPTAMGQEVKSLYDNGFMNSFSIGFIPSKSENKAGQFTWTEWELLEVSAVSIPANPTANIIRSAEAAGLELPTLKSYQTSEDSMENIMSEQELAEFKAFQKKKAEDAARREIREAAPGAGDIRVTGQYEHPMGNLGKAVDAFARIRKAKGDHETADEIQRDHDGAVNAQEYASTLR